MLICMERKKEDDAGLQSRKKELLLIGENPGFIPVNLKHLKEVPALEGWASERSSTYWNCPRGHLCALGEINQSMRGQPVCRRVIPPQFVFAKPPLVLVFPFPALQWGNDTECGSGGTDLSELEITKLN